MMNNKSDISDVSVKRVLKGIVVSTKMKKTVVVRVDRRVKHKEYKKFLMISNRYQAHDESGEISDGDLVEIIECRPMSKHKRWSVQKVLVKSSV